MKNTKLTIKLDELPNRAVNILKDQITEIFGGCGSKFTYCNSASECCPGLFCLTTGASPACA